VSFAVLDGDGVACFPRVRGWSAEDSCRRAIAEHLAWLRAEPGARRSPDSSGDALGLLFTAGRAALFEESLADGDPTLPLTVSETARRLEARSTAARTVAEDALGCYREFASYGNPPPRETVRALRSLVLSLPPYSRAHEPSGGRSTAQF
jgi:hypothetical protein